MNRAIAIGTVAILLWSALALLTAGAGAVPPFELMALSFGVAFAAAAVRIAVIGPSALARLHQPIGAWALCFAGLFLYHALYFFALQAAPPSEASLIAYLWPLFIVLFGAIAPGQGLRSAHLIGAALGLGGTALLILSRNTAAPVRAPAPFAGDVAAFGCALVWSGYSVLNRRYAAVPADVVAAACGAVALAGLACHFLAERWIWPTQGQAAAIVALGLGPVGLAFIAWDHATKHGSLPLLGALSYLAPLVSTLLLVLAGRAAPTVTLFGAAVLILGGAVIAARAERGSGTWGSGTRGSGTWGSGGQKLSPPL